jgi:transposase
MNRKIWSTEEKTAIVLEMIKGDESVAAICTRHRVSASQAYRWQEQFLAGGRSALADRRSRKSRDPVEDENHCLKVLVGQQALVIEAQKKLAGVLPRR